MENPIKPTKEEAVNILWRKGILHWKLNSAQKLLYDTFHSAHYKAPVFLCSRRGGKSWSLLVIALEECIKNPEIIVHYACPTAVMATKIIIPTIRKLLKDCPEDLKPEYIKHDRAFEFPNGSKIQIEGVDEGNAEKLRGSSTHLGIIDEAGFVADLEYLINDILLPQTLTTNGTLLLSSTPPKSAGHSFNKFVEKAEKHNAVVRLPMPKILEMIANDPPHLRNHLSPKLIEDLKENYGGENSPTWRREFLVETITDMSAAVVPEFTEEIKNKTIKEWKRPAFYDAYTAMDPGLVDGTGVLFGYLDFINAKLVIEDEWLANGTQVNTENIASIIKAKEDILWHSNRTEEFGKLYLRVSDNDPILLNDLARLHDLIFVPARKDDKEAAVNDLRLKIMHEKIIIHPRCKNLIFQLRTAIWAKSRKTFERTEDGGHYDLLDALIYLNRTVQWSKNPYNQTVYSQSTHHLGRNGQEKPMTQSARTLKSLFVRKK